MNCGSPLETIRDRWAGAIHWRWRTLDNFISKTGQTADWRATIVGIARGIDAQGALLLEQEEIKPFIGGDIAAQCRNSEKDKGTAASP